jgi:excisionase family DNA binding protein
MIHLTNHLYTISQAAEILQVHVNTVRNLIARGDLKAERIGKSIIRIRQAEIDLLLTPHEATAPKQSEKQS